MSNTATLETRDPRPKVLAKLVSPSAPASYFYHAFENAETVFARSSSRRCAQPAFAQ
ncbi:hypothetical protein Hoch_1428 [Haliangium ochraceum DSM 14365]|uniref:Uncharacterized protein n=1 Tax=Haliangium ochraceum (strain DSM 14365 / JCM 11303 / SMP-2) TaxID=502025 RepID=D0LUU2_HALO1|nr:hypothetical protein Hoch_1428 [Haliangium ochraceum DSM 14365]